MSHLRVPLWGVYVCGGGGGGGGDQCMENSA